MTMHAGADATTARQLDGEDPGKLLDRGQPARDLRQAVVPERPHAAADGCTVDLVACRLGCGERLDLLGHRQQLVDADPAAVARLVAARAAALPIEADPVLAGGDVGRDPSGEQLLD